MIRYWGQYIALAVADTFEAAKAAADAVRATYGKEHRMSRRASKRTMILTLFRPPFAPTDRLQSHRGDGAGLRQRAATLDETYVTPAETHNPPGVALHRRALGRPELHALRNVAGGVEPPACSLRCLGCPIRTFA